MRAAVHGVDVVREAEDVLAVSVVVLECDVHRECAAARKVPRPFEVDRLLVQDVLALVEVPDELGDPPAVQELVRLGRIHPLVGERDLQSLVQERQLAQTLRERVETELRGHHDGGIRLKGDLRSSLAAALAFALERSLRNSALVFLQPGVAIAPDLEIQSFRQCIHATYAHAMQAAGHLVTLGVEFTARM